MFFSRVYGKKAESIGGRLCAMNFLEEEGRGDRFWPPTSDGSLVYENSRDKEIIIENVADLFLIHARSNYCKLHAKRRSKKHNDTSPTSNVNSEHINNKPPTSLIPEETYSEDEEPQFTYSSTVMTIEPELCLAPWLDPPKRFDRNVAIPWAESLNPKNLPNPPVRLGKKLVITGKCTMAVCSRQRNSSLVNLLRNDKGASAELDNTQLREFRKRIVDRVKFFTETFINHQFVELQADGVPQMTGRFRNIWTTLKYETPTPRINSRRRSVEVEAPRESPRKRRKLSKKAEENVIDINRPKRKPWSEHAWRRKTIPPPADMTFPNLFRRKSSNTDPVTEVESPQSTVDEESERSVSEESQIHQDLETSMRNPKVSVEVSPLKKYVHSKSDVAIKMEEESTIEVSQPMSTIMESSDDKYRSEIMKKVPLADGKVTKTSSPNPSDIPAFEQTLRCMEDDANVAESQLPLPRQLNDKPENNRLSKEPRLQHVPTIVNQLLETVGAQVGEVVDAQTQVNGPAQLLPKVDNRRKLPQTTDVSPSPETNETTQIIVEPNSQSLRPDGNGQSSSQELAELASATQVADRTDENLRGRTSSDEIAMENNDQNSSNLVAPSAKSSSETPKKYGPFHDLEYLNKLFSSSGSRPTETYRLRSTASISPTSSAETHTRGMNMNFSPVHATQKPTSPPIAPPANINPKVDHHKQPPIQGDPPVASLITNGPKTSEHSSEKTDSQLSKSGQISFLDALETERKPFEKSISSFTRTPLPSLPLTSSNSQKLTSTCPVTRSSPTTMEGSHTQTYKPHSLQPQMAIQDSQASLCEPLIATFKPINRPMNGSNVPPSIHPLTSPTEPSLQSPVPITHDSGTTTHQPRIESQETPSQRQLQDIYPSYESRETMPRQNVAYEPTITSASSDFSWTRDPNLNPHPINTQNGVYPMAFIKKLTSSKNVVWTPETSRKRTLEGTGAKPRKTKSRKKSGFPEKLSTESATVQYSPAPPSRSIKDIPPSVMQIQSPRPLVHDRKHSPKPPHPDLINHLRIMDENMGVNTGASHQPAFKTGNALPSTANLQQTSHTENADQNIKYHAKQDQNILSYLPLQENTHSALDSSSQGWGKIKPSADVHHATSVAVASSTQQRTSGTPQILPSPVGNPRITRAENSIVEYGAQQDKRLPNLGEENGSGSRDGIRQNQVPPDISDYTGINLQIGRTQSHMPSNVSNKSRVNVENRDQPSNFANLGYSQQARPVETGIRHRNFMNNGKGSTVPQSGSHVYNHAQPSQPPTDTNQYLNQESQVLRHENQNQNNPSSPASYRSQDPWWNSLAANYNIKKISQPRSRFVSHSDTDTQNERLMSNESTISESKTDSPVQAVNQEVLPGMRRVEPQASEPSHPTSSQSANPKAYRQTPESQHTDKRPVQSPNTQVQPARGYSSDQYSAQLSPIQPSCISSQSVPPPSVIRTPSQHNQSSNQISNGTAPSPRTEFYQPPSQLSNVCNISKGQYINDTSGQLPNTQSADFHHRYYSQPPIQLNAIQNSQLQNQSTNKPTQVSPIQASSPKNQHTDPHAIQQGSSAQVPYNPEYNELENQAASQYQHIKWARHPTEAQKSTHEQRQTFNGQQPPDRTHYQLHDPRSQVSMNSDISSPRQPPAATNQALNKSQSASIQNHSARSSPAPNLSTILNHSLPPTPPTPAVIPTPRLDSITQYSPGTHPIAGSTTRQQGLAIGATPKLDTISQYPPMMHPLAGSPTHQQISAVTHTPKLDVTYPYSPITHPLATPQPTPTTPQAVGPKLDFYLQRSTSTIDTTNSFSYQYMEALSLSNLFSFFSQHSGVPLEKLDEITFRCMFGEYQQFVIGKSMGDGEWKRARKRIWRNWDREVRAVKQHGGDDDEEFWEVNILIGRCA
ncbi:hypothetical protein EYC84_002373 [Monilinia fructicola]|uniref:Uncharacterized protein n=1 Tax=Monilinia fructicola TaxID=38448 RepID=A0A5M9JQF6_MONFR|nr:hypothetical protein EYC84_002373 [Monilinia fructicola]